MVTCRRTCRMRPTDLAAVDYLWSPWRYQYLTAPAKPSGCIFCAMAAEHRDEENLIVYRGVHNFIVLNRFPYTSGHVMVVPYTHAARLAEADEATTVELMSLVRAAEAQLFR